MIDQILKYVLTCALVMSFTVLALAQEKVITKTEVIVNPDGTYTVIEYPVGKEVTVTLSPSGTLTGGKGTAKVIRAADGTKILLDFTGLPATSSRFYAYAIDPSGMPTLLGPLTVENGIARAEFTTPMSQFMLALSPLEGLTAITPANVVFTSAVPAGYTIVPRRGGQPVVAAVGASTFVSYEVPMLNVPTFGEAERELKLKFGGELSGLEAKAFIDREKGTTKVKMEFDDMRKVPSNKRFVLWAYSPDGKYTKLGQVINSGKRDEATIKTETSLTDFGLLVTVEDSEVSVPTSRIYSVFTVISQ